MKLRIEDGHVMAPDIDGVYGKRGVYRRIDRLVMAKALGRPLAPDEVVAHSNFDLHDNRIENLELLTGRGKWDYLNELEERRSAWSPS